MLSASAVCILRKLTNLRTLAVIRCGVIACRGLFRYIVPMYPCQQLHSYRFGIVNQGAIPQQPDQLSDCYAGVDVDNTTAKNAVNIIASVIQYNTGFSFIESSVVISIS